MAEVVVVEEEVAVVDLIRVQTRTKQVQVDTITRRHRISHYIL